MLKPSICDYSDASILVNGTITTIGTNADEAAQRADKNK